jgi:hypothetical protein
MFGKITSVVRSKVSVWCLAALLFLVSLFMPAASVHAQVVEILRVDIVNGTTTDDGTDWGPDAIKYLQDALVHADQIFINFPETDEVHIWVAAAFDENGDPIAYRPDQGEYETLGDRNATVHLRNRIAIYGGFPPDPHTWNNNSGAIFDDRDWKAYPTVLSGDLDQNSTFIVDCGDGTFCEHGVRVDDQGEPVQDADCDTCRPVGFTFTNYETNSERIVEAGNVDATGVLDGFHIRHGYGGVGKAIRITGGNPTIERCVAEYHVIDPATFTSGPGWDPGQFPGGVISFGATFQNPEVVLKHLNVRHNLDLVAVGFTGQSSAHGAALLFSRVSNNLLGQSAVHTLIKATVLNSAVTGNDLTFVESNEEGAGVSVFGGGAFAQIWNSVIADNKSDNHGGGIWIGGHGGNATAEIVNCTIARNELDGEDLFGPGVFVGQKAKAEIFNSIIWENVGGTQGEQVAVAAESELTMEHSNVEDGESPGVICGQLATCSMSDILDADPEFVDSEAGNYRLKYLSPSIDEGSNSRVHCNEVQYGLQPGPCELSQCDSAEFDWEHPIDLDGLDRILDCEVVDHGAYEFQGLDCGTCRSDLNNDGQINVSDLLLLFDCWGEVVQENCECADLNDDGVVNVSDLLDMFDDWGPCPTLGSEQVPQAVQDCVDLLDEHGLQAVIDCLDQL